MLDLPRKRHKHACNWYYKDPAPSRNVTLVHMSATWTMKYPFPTLEKLSFLLPSLEHPSGRADKLACTG